MKTTKQILGEQLTALRVSAGLSIVELAGKLKTSRSHITDIEAGRKNFTADFYDKAVKACNASPAGAFAGVSTSDLPPGFHDLYWMIGAIVQNGDTEEGERLIDAARVNLELISEKAIRLKRTRGSPPNRVQEK